MICSGRMGKVTKKYGMLQMAEKKLNGGRDRDCLFYPRVAGKQQRHLNQKPVEMLEYLIAKSTNENDVVLDSFMGSGSTGVACLNTKRNFIRH